MQHYVVIANDGTDENALDRRLNTRPFHLEGAQKLKEQGNFVIGGAMLSDTGRMKGSVMIVQFESDEDLQHWLANEPYIKQGVWKDYQVIPFKVANV